MMTTVAPSTLAETLAGAALELVVARLEIGALRLELLLVRFGRAQRLAARQQEVAGVAVLDVDRVAHVAELADALEQNDIHDGLLFVTGWFWGGKKSGAGAQAGEGVDEAEHREDGKDVFRPQHAAGVQGDQHHRAAA